MSLPGCVVDTLRRSGAVLETQTGQMRVATFGDAGQEHAAALTAAVCVPLGELVRIRVAGRDRAKFLHNFCTNEIKGLSSGTACEAFFTDVRARVLAHGWVLAGEADHELWMLPGDEAALLKHLNRYVITEDVQFQSVSSESVAVAVFGPAAEQCLQGDSILRLCPHDLQQWADVATPTDMAAGRALRLQWAGQPLWLLQVPVPMFDQVWQLLGQGGLRPAGWPVWERLRIVERFPIVGVDLTAENLAPEADRNPVAISYRKGCYLGQEPIARLDAMGHVNRAVRALHVAAAADACQGATVRHPTAGGIGPITSQAPDCEPETAVVLGLVKVHGVDLTQGLTVETSDGRSCPAHVL